MSRLKIKGDNGWFAAAAGWQAALEKLSDGAFKLFVHISLGAERSTGRFLFRQQDRGQGAAQIAPLDWNLSPGARGEAGLPGPA